MSSDISVLAEKIKVLARSGAFSEAEMLRGELMQLDPMALTHIVSTAEVIEEEKTKNLDTDHLAVWQELYDDFSPEETNCLFYSLTQTRVKPGKLLLAQGKPSNRLFFIDSGRVTVFYRKDEKNIPALQLSRGDILGEDTFFGISLCSFSVATQSDVSLRHVSRKDAERWHEDQPGLYEKLADFCRKNGKCEEAIRLKNIEKRKYSRFTGSAVVTAYLLDKEGTATDTYFRGGLEDISQTGICFSMKCSKKKTARDLLSKQLDLSVVFDDENEKPFTTRGVIVKVSFHLHNDYAVHVKLGNKIPEELFKTFPCERVAGGNRNGY